MESISRSTLSPYSPLQLFDMVNDVARYPEFVPGVKAIKIRHSTEGSIEVELTLVFAGIRQRLVTRNYPQSPHSIRMQQLQGPFRVLDGSWTFTADRERGDDTGSSQPLSKVELSLNFVPKSRLLAAVAHRFSENLADRMVAAMTVRADQLYGEQVTDD